MARQNGVWAIVAAPAEPFMFQVVRHDGAVSGWVSFLTGHRRRGSRARPGLAAPVPDPNVI